MVGEVMRMEGVSSVVVFCHDSIYEDLTCVFSSLFFFFFAFFFP